MCLPWKNPVPLTRAWCLWEIFCTTNTGSQLTLLLSPKQENEFLSTLQSNPEQVMDNFCKEKGAAIMKTYEEILGSADPALFDQLYRFAEFGMGAKEPKAIFSRAYAGLVAHHGIEYYNTGQCSNLLGNFQLKSGKTEEAKRLYILAYNFFVKNVGPSDYLTKSAKMGINMLGGFSETDLKETSPSLQVPSSDIQADFMEALQSQVITPNANMVKRMVMGEDAMVEANTL